LSGATDHALVALECERRMFMLAARQQDQDRY
jgi:hypothetical protein